MGDQATTLQCSLLSAYQHLRVIMRLKGGHSQTVFTGTFSTLYVLIKYQFPVSVTLAGTFNVFLIKY